MSTAIERAWETLSAISASHAEDWRAAASTMEHLPAFRERYGQRVEPEADTHNAQVFALLAKSLAARTVTPQLPEGEVIDAEVVD